MRPTDSSFPPPILVAPLLRVVDARLVELLRSLGPGEWETQTVAPAWRVKDVAAHLLDTSLRKLSICRDGSAIAAPPIRSAADLAGLVNRMNAEGVAVYRRLSTRLLIDLIAQASLESAAFHESLDPYAPAAFAVSWAGDETSPNWFDTARELTERWHHQQQIRLAVGKPGIMTRELYHPVLDCFLRALPHLYRGVPAPDGATVAVEVSGPCGGTWQLRRDAGAWRLVPSDPSAFDDAPDDAGTAARDRRPRPVSAARTVIPEEIAWRVFTKGIAAGEARAAVRIEGDAALGEHVLRLVAIVA